MTATSNAAIPPELRLAAAVVRLDERRVERDDGASLALTEQEANLLAWLAAHPGEVVSREVLAVSVLGYSPRARSRAVDHAVARLRVKIETDPAEPRALLTVHGVGYRLVIGTPIAPVQVAGTAPRRLVRGPITVDLDARRVDRGDEVVALTDSEAALLDALDAARGRVLARDELARRVRGRGDGRALDHLVHRLRAKIEPDPDAPVWLLTERGRGYRLSVAPAAVECASDAFVGREGELRELRAALATHRLVVLAGTAGIGKSRLAAELAARSAERYDAVVVVALGRVAGAGEALAAVASGLGLPAGADAADTIGRALAHRGRTLLILDDAEAAHGLGDVLPGWLRAASGLHVVATSREATGPGAVAHVPPLSVGDGADGGEAAALFVARAGGVEVDPQLVASIVARLDGIPLAIELAAGRLRVMSPAELLARLDRPLDLLVSGDAGNRRHATMRAAIDASADLLPPSVGEAYARLGVFRGAFGLHAAEAVLAGVGGWPANVVQTLVERNLVALVAREPATRFRLYDAIRAHAAERAATAGIAAEAERAHARHYAEHGEDDAVEALFGADGARRRAALEADSGEIAAALDGALTRGDAEVAGPLLAAMAEILLPRGGIPTLDALAERVLELVLPPAWRARVLRYAAVAAWFSARRDVALERIEEAEALAAVHGTPRCAVMTSLNLGWFCCDRGRLDEARGHYARATERAARHGFDRLGATIAGNTAIIEHEAGRLAAARVGYLSAAATLLDLGDVRNAAMFLSNLALVHDAEGDEALAADAFDRAAVAYLEAGDRRGYAHQRINYAALVRGRGEPDVAASILGEALSIARALGNRRLEGLAIGGLAFVQADQGRTTDAITGCGRAMALMERMGERPTVAAYQALRGWLRVVDGDPDGLADLDAAVDQTSASGVPVRIPKLRARRGDARRRLGDLAGAAADLDLAAEEARTLEPAATPWVLALRALLAADAGDPRARERLAEAERAAAGQRGPDADLRRALDLARSRIRDELDR